jgi:hypothetical protein
MSDKFDWPLAFEAENFLRHNVGAFLDRNGFARLLAGRMRDETGTDFFEWIDHMVLPKENEKTLLDLGYVADRAETPHGETVLAHPRATLPRVILAAADKSHAIALRPEFAADFAAAHSLTQPIDGEPFSQLRSVVVSEENGTRLTAVERNGYRGFVSAPLSAEGLRKIIKATDLWRTRRRSCASESEGFAVAGGILDQVLDLVGQDFACQLFFAEERRYWEGRNHAAQVQKRRQDVLGLGWGNHDHHTFRSSRECFVDLNNFLLRLGFHKRERYYAGAEAGWGAQISEQSNIGIVVFADVDLMPDETQIDFSSKRLGAAEKLGTVGLWVGLHGESFLQAGMHHLEARFDFEQLRDQLERQGVHTMKPFSNFEFLRQAFTEGERWPVAKERVEKLLRDNLVTREQAERFAREGAIGSHLENLQRRGGFKGFNQKAVSVIISATDPRKNLQHSSADAADPALVGT